MVFAQFEEMAEDGDCAWNLGKALDVRNICCDEPLERVSLLLQVSRATMKFTL
jgi:hypothetical protein